MRSLSGLRKFLPAEYNRRISGYKKSLRSAYLKHRYPFTAKDLACGLSRCGVRAGDALMVHSSYADFDGFQGSAMDVVSVLRSVVTPGGTLLMATIPFSGSAVEYAARGKVFDPFATPSQMGILTELFRRSNGVERSLHPTHSVAAVGEDAAFFLSDHLLAGTPCGRGTPYHRLIERDGKVLLLNVGIAALTLYHAVEELIEPLMSFSPFTKNTFILRVRQGSDIVESSPMRLFDPDVSARRNLEPLAGALRASGCWHETKVANVRLTVLGARDVLRAAEELARQGIFCYEAEP